MSTKRNGAVAYFLASPPGGGSCRGRDTFEARSGLLGTLLAGARRHEADIRCGRIRGDLDEAEGLVQTVEVALDEIDMASDWTDAARLLIEAAGQLLEMHERHAWAAR